MQHRRAAQQEAVCEIGIADRLASKLVCQSRFRFASGARRHQGVCGLCASCALGVQVWQLECVTVCRSIKEDTDRRIVAYSNLRYWNRAFAKLVVAFLDRITSRES